MNTPHDQRPDDWDALLDEAGRQWEAPCPASLAEGVMARVNAAPPARRWWLAPALLALPAAALLAILLLPGRDATSPLMTQPIPDEPVLQITFALPSLSLDRLTDEAMARNTASLAGYARAFEHAALLFSPQEDEPEG